MSVKNISRKSTKKTSVVFTWKWHSTLESAEKYELSILAIFETIIAVIVYIMLAVNGLSIHLLAAVFIAPLLLLRTQQSVELGVEVGVRRSILLLRRGIELFTNSFETWLRTKLYFFGGILFKLLYFFILSPIIIISFQ